MAIRDESKPYILDMPAKIAAKYGGNKQAIQQAALTGQVGPTEAVLAGMFIDKIRSAAALENVPNQTIYEKTFAPPQAQAPAGLGATPQAQQMSQMAPPPAPTQMAEAPPAQPTAMLADGGLASLPVDESMFPDEYAGGGVVAFAAGSQEPISSDIVERETKEISEGRRLDYSPQALQIMRERGKQTRTAGQRAYLTQEQQRMLASGRDIARTSGLEPSMAPPVPAPVSVAPPKPTTPSLPPVSPAYPDETTRGTAKSILAGDIRARDFSPPVAPEPAPAPAPKAPAPLVSPLAETKGPTFDEYQELLKKAGVSGDPFAEDRAAAAKRASEIAGRRKENQGLALISAGLAGMNTKNIAEFAEKAAKEGITQYKLGDKEIRADENELDKINRDLRKAEQALKRNDVEKYMEFKDKAIARSIQLKGVEAQIAAANKPSTFQEVSAALRSKDPAVRKAAEQYLGVGRMGGISDKDIYAAWTKAQSDPAQMIALKRQGITTFDQFKAAQLAASGGGARFLGFE